MKIIHKDLKKGIVKIKTENQDDLWYLSNIIDESDLVEGATYRKIKLGKEETSDVVKKKVYLKIEVEKVEFHKYSKKLRISGKIIEGPEDISKGSYHTFNIDENSEIKIEKERWYGYQEKKLKEASEISKSKILIVLFDREEAIFARFGQTNYEIIMTTKGTVAKKDRDIQHSNFYSELYQLIIGYDGRENFDHIIIASPSFFTDYLFKEITDEKILKKIVKATCSSVSKSSINEVINRPELHTVLSKQQAASEIHLIERLLGNISKGTLSAYGIKEVQKAADYGAIETLLVSDGLISKKREEEKFNQLESIMKNVDKSKGVVHIINSDHEGGKKLDGLGGIAAMLRYGI